MKKEPNSRWRLASIFHTEGKKPVSILVRANKEHDDGAGDGRDSATFNDFQVSHLDDTHLRALKDRTGPF